MAASALWRKRARLWRRAGVGPKDMSMAQLYDCFTYMVLAQLGSSDASQSYQRDLVQGSSQYGSVCQIERILVHGMPSTVVSAASVQPGSDRIVAAAADAQLAQVHYNLGLLYLFSDNVPGTTPAFHVAPPSVDIHTGARVPLDASQPSENETTAICSGLSGLTAMLGSESAKLFGSVAFVAMSTSVCAGAKYAVSIAKRARAMFFLIMSLFRRSPARLHSCRGIRGRQHGDRCCSRR
jgi:hypothetical protein